MIRVDIIAADTAYACGHTVKNTKGAVCALARKLIADGYAEHDLVEVYRGHMQTFRKTPLSWWAARTVREGDTSVKFARYAPMPTGLHEAAP